MASYVQDVEYNFPSVKSDPPLVELAKKSLDIPSIRFAKTQWIAEEIKRDTGNDVNVISPALDTDIFYPGICAGKKYAICAMYRPSTKQRGAPLLIEILSDLMSRNAALDINVAFFGDNIDNVPAALASFSERIQGYLSIVTFIYRNVRLPWIWSNYR